eukprot:3379662-Pyramimonas_sp.AAC.1
MNTSFGSLTAQLLDASCLASRRAPPGRFGAALGRARDPGELRGGGSRRAIAARARPGLMQRRYSVSSSKDSRPGTCPRMAALPSGSA